MIVNPNDEIAFATHTKSPLSNFFISAPASEAGTLSFIAVNNSASSTGLIWYKSPQLSIVLNNAGPPPQAISTDFVGSSKYFFQPSSVVAYLKSISVIPAAIASGVAKNLDFISSVIVTSCLVTIVKVTLLSLGSEPAGDSWLALETKTDVPAVKVTSTKTSKAILFIFIF